MTNKINESLNEPLKFSREKEARILDLIAVHPGIQRKAIAQELHISLATVKRVLGEMTSNPDQAKIEHRGSKKTGGWFIKS